MRLNFINKIFLSLIAFFSVGNLSAAASEGSGFSNGHGGLG